MITVQYKENGEWKSDDATFRIPEHAKAHTVKCGYAEYKLWKDDGATLLAHLFNDVKPAPKKKKVSKPDPEPVEELDHEESHDLDPPVEELE